MKYYNLIKLTFHVTESIIRCISIDMLFEYIIGLFNSMLRHGISPDEFLVSILIPIP